MQRELKSDISSPLVSFIITTSNHQSEYLVECVKSILQLSLNAKEREFILIDDGSEEMITNQIKELPDNILYLRLPGLGRSVARNYGMKIANGKYIQFIDGKDYFLQAPYEHCLDIVRYHQPDIVTFNCCKKNKTIEPSYELPTPVTGTYFLKNNNLQGSACSYIFRHSIIGSLQFTPELMYGEDEEFTPKLFLRAERIFKTDTEAYFYRDSPKTISTQLNKEKVQQRMANSLEVILRLQDLLYKIPVAERQALNRRIAQLSMDYLYNNIRQNHSLISLNKCIKQLKEHGLYPLPNKDYTKEYTIFRKAIGSYIGRLALLFIIKKCKNT